MSTKSWGGGQSFYEDSTWVNWDKKKWGHLVWNHELRRWFHIKT